MVFSFISMGVVLLVWTFVLIVDIGTTLVGVQKGLFEKNKLVAWSLKVRYGEVLFTLIMAVIGAVVFFSIKGLWLWVPAVGSFVGGIALGYRVPVVWNNCVLICKKDNPGA